MKKVFTIFLFLVFFTTGHAQGSLPPFYLITTDTVYELVIDNLHWQVLEDKAGKWTIGDVSSEPLAGKFYYKGTAKGTDTIVNTHWLRYRLKNTMATDAHLSFVTGSQQSDFYMLYNNGEPAHFSTGVSYPWSKKDGLKKANAIPFSLQPGKEVTIYQRRYLAIPGSVNAQLKMRLLGTEKLKNAELKDYQDSYVKKSSVFQAFIAGLFVLAAVFNFLVYWRVRDKVYLYFSLFLLFISLFYLPVFTELVLDNNAVLSATLPKVIGPAWPVFFLFFVRRYFSLKTLYPRWDKLMVMSSYVILVFTAAGSVFSNMYFSFLSGILKGVYLLFVLVTLVFCLRRPGEQRKIFVMAVSPFIIFFITMLLLVLFSLDTTLIDETADTTNNLLSLCIVWAAMVLSSFLFKRYGLQQKQIVQDQLEKEKMAREKEEERNALIAVQKIDLEKQVAERTNDLRHSLEDLKAAQAQLIQSEKMASLGELTAGIAHEIQNPLNFVNNFSEVNTELIEELKGERLKAEGMRDILLEDELLNDISQNLEKINHHGKRADAIVKGMLQHSRSSSATKEATDINRLADEYLRLAYHGLRAKDKSFNAILKTDYDETIGPVNLIPQDIGRVMLNLIMNALYATNEKKQSQAAGYEPTVSISTNATSSPSGGRSVRIKVADNGGGIPRAIVDKIFQPFFTTKPTGQGTGLGLSLSYDIVKAHGGELKVETKEGEGAEFVIQLPIQ